MRDKKHTHTETRMCWVGTAEIKKVGGGGAVNRRRAPGSEERNENERDKNEKKEKKDVLGEDGGD